jgi:hypothetical protein
MASIRVCRLLAELSEPRKSGKNQVSGPARETLADGSRAPSKV